MAQVIIALGSNLDNPLLQFQKAFRFLEQLSEKELKCSSIFESEPVGPSKEYFLNAVVIIDSQLNPEQLLLQLKLQEKVQGRPTRYPKWTARSIDYDIIDYDGEIFKSDQITLPHPEFRQRLFVLLPLEEVLPNWIDPVTKKSLSELIEIAPSIEITKTELNWIA